MKKKFLSLILAMCLIVPCAFLATACKNSDDKNKNPDTSAVVYTVSEDEWETNFKITQVGEQTQTQAVSYSLLSNSESRVVQTASAKSLAEITSYTLSATGTDYRDEEPLRGSGVLKVAPNGLDMEFYLEEENEDGILELKKQDEQTQVIPNTDKQYIGLKAMLTSYFKFSGKFNRFTFDTTKNAYVAENLTVSVVNEDDINDTYNLYNKKVEVTFINGYLNTISVELCGENFAEDIVYQTFMFTFSDINNTTVTID